MERLIDVASCIYNDYYNIYKIKIDEMKLHKLLYFAQRESFIQDGKPLFDSTFYGWKYGPVLKEIREIYKEDSFIRNVSENVIMRISHIIKKIFKYYAGKDSLSLSRLTCGELSWKNSRIGIPEEVNSDNPMSIDDIRKDADRIRRRRIFLSQLKFRTN